VLSKKVAVREGGIHGHCWFAGEDIKAGEMVWEQGEQKYHDVDISVEELATWPKAKRDKYLSLAYVVIPGFYRGSDPTKTDIPQEELNEYFVNHSCDGNCWYEGEEKLIAMRDISAGEEIAYDYALTECQADWILADKCLCGKNKCRGMVTGNDWKRADLQAAYGKHFTTHIIKLIEENSANKQ